MDCHLLIFVAIFLGAMPQCKSELQNNNQPPVECAPYCLNLIMENTAIMNSKLETCDKINLQMSNLQSQLAVLKYKENICERTIREREEKCKNQEQLDADLNSLKNLMLHLANQSRKESQKLKELLKQIEDYRLVIESKNDLIRSLETKIQFDAYTAEMYKLNLTLTDQSAAFLLMDFRPEKHVKILEKSCLNIGNTTDIRQIQVPGIHSFFVPCDGTIDGPGWAVIQQRVDNSEDFNRNWTEYRNGFGNLEKNFFIGLEKIYRMTNSQPHELYIKLENFTGAIRFERYNNFSIGSENEDYELKVLDGFSGDAGNALQLSYKMKFSTFDRDNDKHYGNCAKERNGGWWFNQCSRANLNGRYYESVFDMWDGIFWWTWQEFRTLKKVQMMIRPSNITATQK